MKTFRHAGDRGDIIYSLPVMRHLGGGTMLIESAPYTREQLTPDKWAGLDKILLEQPYVIDVKAYDGGVVDVNLNDFRDPMFKAIRAGHSRDVCLAEWMCRTHKVPVSTVDRQWLDINPHKVVRVVISRSGAGRNGRHVYHNPEFPWRRVMDKYAGDDVVFLGTELEHAVFSAQIADVQHYRTPSLYEAARVIAGADMFIGNQNCLAAIAEGLKKKKVLEVWPAGPNCLFTRDGVVNVFGYDQELPDL